MRTRHSLVPLTVVLAVVGGACSGPSDEVPSRSRPTDAAKRTAMQLRQQVIDHVRRSGWTDSVGAAAAAGYEPMAGDESHWVNPAFETDGRTFDPTAPEFLVLDKDKVVGTMFLAA